MIYTFQYSLKRYDTDKVIYLDRDGVLNKKIEDGYVLLPDQLEIINPGLVQKCLDATPYVIIVSNQRYIDKELLTVDQLREIDFALRNRVGELYASLYATGEDCKPSPKMIYHARKILGFHGIEIMIGDSQSDKECAEAAGIHFIWADESFQLNCRC